MAGIFGFFDYTKPGKGVRKDEPERSRFVKFFVLLWRKLGMLIKLNLLFVLFCAPAIVIFFAVSGIPDVAKIILLVIVAAITIGPAVAGMTYVLRNFVNEKPVFLLSDFWDAFKNNFKQSIIYEILLAASAYVLWIAWQFYFGGARDNFWLYIPAAFIFLLTLLLLFANFYIFLMIVTVKLPLRAIIKNGFLLSVLGMKYNLFTTLFVAITVFALWCIYITGYLLYVVIGFAFIGFIVVYNAYPPIKKYIIDPYIEQSTGGDEEEDENIFADE